MKPLLILLVVLYCYCANANCLLQKISINERTKSSQLIINGEVINQRFYWNANKTSIYTVNTVIISDFLKGTNTTSIDVITPGGEIDGKLLVVEPNAELKIGSKGIFFLKENTIDINYISIAKKFEIYSLAQGFIERNQITNTYKDPFDEYQNINTVASIIGKTTGIAYKFRNTTANRFTNNETNRESSTILLTPENITAGTGSILTISGAGFGTRTGGATIQFRDANSTSTNSFVSIPDSSYIVSWTNTEIRVIVPGASLMRGGAGTGFVNIIKSNGSIISSTNPLSVIYNQFEFKKNRVVLIDENTLGGYTFTLNTTFNDNAVLKATFLRALDQWKCKTGVNFIISPNTTTNSCSNQNDNLNIITFADGSCPLPNGTLGITYSTYFICSGSPIIPDEIDMIFSSNHNFYIGPYTPPTNLYDFESVVLHELGHAFGQGHNSSGSEIMYPSIGIGQIKRTLNVNTDIVNVLDVIARSAVSTSNCGYNKFVPLITTCLEQTTNTPIVASFISDKTVGCAPLTVSFTDQSTGNPTVWNWDIDNNGKTEYTSKNATHTFTNPGTYNVKLVAINGNVKDSIIKMAQITVAPTLKASVIILQNVSCNNGNNGTLKSLSTGGNGTYSYLWNNNQTTSTASNLNAGNYTVTVKDGYNCVSTATNTITQPDSLNVKINTHSTKENKYYASLDVIGGTAPYTYFLNNNVITPLNSIIENLSVENYILAVTDKNNCIKSTSFSISVPTSVIDAEKSIDALDIYPNPAFSNVYIHILLKKYQDINVSLYNLSGQTFFEEKYDNIKEKQGNIDLSTLASGTYILKFGLEEGNTFRKIIIN